MLERLYRSGFGVGFYYLIELWWKRLYVPSMPHSKPRRKGFTLDFTLTTVYGIAWVAAVVLLAQQAGVGTLAALISAVLVPFFAWGVLVGLTIHVHHIHPDIPWYTDRKAWKEAQAVYTGTAHIDWPVANFLFHNIFEHQAHHIDARINLFELKAAQTALEQEFPGVFTRRKLSWGDYFAGVKTCKVFDYQEKVWKPFPQS
jgi:omega-6 fatty acid desaturase (delta-12 desaturase)